jgi:hypothetical protein
VTHEGRLPAAIDLVADHVAASVFREVPALRATAQREIALDALAGSKSRDLHAKLTQAEEHPTVAERSLKLRDVTRPEHLS